MDIKQTIQEPQGFLPQPASSSKTRRSIAPKLLGRLRLISLASLFFVVGFLARDFIPSGNFSYGSHKTNVIMMISDGFGPASETFARAFHQALNNNTSPDAHFRLPLDEILVGASRSRSSDSLITDSAAGATAFSCALKSYNGAIGVDPAGKPCGTVFEAAKKKGLLTGVVVTSRLTDATPAAFASHVSNRGMEAQIAEQEVGDNPLGRVLDLAIGGGGCYFLPRSHSLSCRTDDKDLTHIAQKQGWTVHSVFNSSAGAEQVSLAASDEVPDRTALLSAPQQDGESLAFTETQLRGMGSPRETFERIQEDGSDLPLLALLTPGNTDFDIDRVEREKHVRGPSLAEMAKKALSSLQRSPSNKHGFILMIEGSQIDICGHFNDPACHAREILAYQEAIAVVRRFVHDSNARGERTVMISTSDHETGGLTLGRQLTASYPNYAYYPSHLLSAKHSGLYLSIQLLAFAGAQPPPTDDALRTYIQDEVLVRGAGFADPQPTDAEVEAVLQALQPGQPADQPRRVLADLASRRAEMGWSTEGHTGVDVNLYASGYRAGELRGNHENTEIGDFIASFLKLNLKSITRELNKQ